MIAREIGSRALIVSMPPMLAYQGVRMLGWVLGDVWINTGDEVRGIMQGRLYVDSPPLGSTKLSDWVRAYRREIGHDIAAHGLHGLAERLLMISVFRGFAVPPVERGEAETGARNPWPPLRQPASWPLEMTINSRRFG